MYTTYHNMKKWKIYKLKQGRCCEDSYVIITFNVGF